MGSQSLGFPPCKNVDMVKLVVKNRLGFLILLYRVRNRTRGRNFLETNDFDFPARAPSSMI